MMVAAGAGLRPYATGTRYAGDMRAHMAIEASHYEQARQVLRSDPIVQDMAAGLRGAPRAELAHDDGTPRFEFMGAANREYAKRGGTHRAHIGAVAEALLSIIAEGEQE